LAVSKISQKIVKVEADVADISPVRELGQSCDWSNDELKKLHSLVSHQLLSQATGTEVINNYISVHAQLLFHTLSSLDVVKWIEISRALETRTPHECCQQYMHDISISG
jgi:hypothetical protein